MDKNGEQPTKHFQAFDEGLLPMAVYSGYVQALLFIITNSVGYICQANILVCNCLEWIICCL